MYCRDRSQTCLNVKDKANIGIYKNATISGWHFYFKGRPVSRILS